MDAWATLQEQRTAGGGKQASEGPAASFNPSDEATRVPNLLHMFNTLTVLGFCRGAE